MSGPPLTGTLWCQGFPGVVPTPFPAPVRALVAGSPPGLSPIPHTSQLHILLYCMQFLAIALPTLCIHVDFFSASSALADFEA